MKKKLFTLLLLFGIISCTLAGCQQKETSETKVPVDEVITEEPTPEPTKEPEPELIAPEEVTPVEIIVPTETTQTTPSSESIQKPTSEPEQEVTESPTESVPAETTPEEPALPICSGCEQEKECGIYVVNNVEYIVCDDCYEEFATGMGLINIMICSGCEVEKECSIYKVDGQEYIVCDDCYEEFATGMGLLD